jgi:hypothetical protein
MTQGEKGDGEVIKIKERKESREPTFFPGGPCAVVETQCSLGGLKRAVWTSGHMQIVNT